MAHIPDGVLSAPVLAVGGIVSAGLLTIALRRLDDERLPQSAVLSAAFFVSSLMVIPIGPSSVHLLLNGLMGLLLGWTAVPALFVALVLQAVFFAMGGIVVIGVNTMNLAVPALLCALVFRSALGRAAGSAVFWIGAGAGALGVLSTAALVALSLALSGEPFQPAARILVIAYTPLALVEAFVTGTAVAFLHRVDPHALPRPRVSRGAA